MSAIRVFGARKYYQSTFETKHVLNGFCMDVKRGSIYALMGASGCGKTTLMSCMVGVNELNSGEIEVFGKPASELDKSRVGYMPQDMAMIPGMTVREMIWFFGTIFGLSTDLIDERFYFLSKLLELPDGDRLIKDCSGGQQRRVSFALTLVHEPEILILDEPTVGVDPLLRSRIWDYLVELTNSKNVTVVLSTHYIEEAKGSDRVGLMRNGVQIAEDSPRNILEMCNVANLEEAFLKLSENQEKAMKKEAASACPSHVPKPSTSYQRPEITPQNEVAPASPASNKNIMKALLMKNFKSLYRNPHVISMTILLPIAAVFCLNYTVGHEIKGLILGVVNEEVPNSAECFNKDFNTSWTKEFDCIVNKTSCEFIRVFGNEFADLKFFNTSEEAKSEVIAGRLLGMIVFSSNFTESMVYFNDAAVNDPSDNGVIKIYLDQTDLQKTTHIQRKLYDTYQEFTENLMGGCGKARRAGNSPIVFEAASGELDFTLKRTVVSSLVILMFFSLASFLTAMSIITERAQGTWSRFIIAGVKPHHFLLSCMIEGFCIMLIQLAIYFIFTVGFLSAIQTVNSIVLIGVLFFLNGLVGIFFGLLVSILAKSVNMAFAVAQFFVFPVALISGPFWPIESIPHWLATISRILPFSHSTIALRNLLTKDSDICQRDYMMAVSVYSGWIIVVLFLSFYTLKK